MNSSCICRHSIVSTLQAMSSIWQLVVTEHGNIVSSLLAIGTFACMAALIYVLHQTLASRTAQHQLQHPKAVNKPRKRQKKNNHQTRNRKSKPKQVKDVCDSFTEEVPIKETTSADDLDEQLLTSISDHTTHSGSVTCESTPESSPQPIQSLLSISNPQKVTAPKLRCMSTDSVATSSDISTDTVRSMPTTISQESRPRNIVLDRPSNRNQRSSRTHRRRKKSEQRTSNASSLNASSPVFVPKPSSRWDSLKPSNRRTTPIQTPPRVKASSHHQPLHHMNRGPGPSNTVYKPVAFSGHTAMDKPLLPSETIPSPPRSMLSSVNRTVTAPPGFTTTQPAQPSSFSSATTLPTWTPSPTSWTPPRTQHVRANPFDDEPDLEAEMQALGGRIVGSILE